MAGGAVIGSLRVALGLDSAQFDAGVARAGSASKRLQGEFRNLDQDARTGGSGLQNLGFQVQDLAVQISGGTDATRALAQQLPQLLGGFGGIGIAIGTVSAVAIPLAAHFLGLGNSAEEAGKQIDALGAAVDDYASAARAAAQSPDKIAEVYGINIEQAQELLDVMREIKRLEAETGLRGANDAVAGITGDFTPFAADGVTMALERRLELLKEVEEQQAASDAAQAKNDREAMAAASDRIAELMQQVRATDLLDVKVGQLASTLGLGAASAANELAVALAAVDDSADPSDQADAWQQVQRALLEIKSDYGTLNEEGIKLLDQAAKAEDAALRIAAIDLASGIGSAADEAARLAENFQRSLDAYTEYQQSRDAGRLLGLNGGPSGTLADVIIGVESGGDPSARNGSSTATGLGQFIESTWLALFKEHFPDQASGMTDAAILALREDAATSRQMVELYLQENAKLLAQAGVAVTDANLYLAHFLGPQGAIGVLQNLDAKLSETVNAASLAANPSVMNGGMTGNDLLAWAQGKVGVSETELAVARTAAAQATREAEEAERERERAAQEAAKTAERELGLRQDLIAASQRQTADAEFELSLIGKSVEEQARLRAAYILTNQAAENGIDLNERIAGSTQTYGQMIEEASIAAGRAAGQEDALTEARDRAAQSAADAAAEMARFATSLTNLALDPITSSPIGGALSILPGFTTGAESVIGGFTSGGFAGAGAALSSALSGATSGLAGLGTAIGAIAGPVGAAIGLFNALKGSTEVLETGLGVAIKGLDEITAWTWEVTETSRLGGLMKFTGSSTSDAPDALTQALDKAFGEISGNILDLAATAGIGAKAFEDFKFKMLLDTTGMDEEQAQQAVIEKFQKASDAMARMAGATGRWIEEGETATQALERMVSTFAVVNAGYDQLGFTQLKAGESSVQLAAKMAEAAGGMDELAASFDTYFSEFYSTAEQAAEAQEAFNEALADLHITRTIDDMEEFREEVERLEAAGKDEKAAGLIALSDEFVTMLDLMAQAAEETGEAVADAADVEAERADLERQILELQGNQAELDRLWIDSLDDSNEALGEQVLLLQQQADLQAELNSLNQQWYTLTEQEWRLRQMQWQETEDALKTAQLSVWLMEDWKDIQAERYSLETQLLELQGDTAELRARELEELSPYNRALQEQVWALEDAKAAVDALNESDFATLFDYQVATAAAQADMAAQTDAAFAGVEDSNRRVEREVAGLRTENRQIGMQLVTLTQKMARILDGFDRIGMPDVRAA